MSQKQEEIKEYADGWITERKGTEVPTFLRFAYIIIAGAGAAYLVLYMNGETGHAERGPLVQAFNKVSQSADGLMYFIAAMVVVYLFIVVGFAFKKFHED